MKKTPPSKIPAVSLRVVVRRPEDAADELASLRRRLMALEELLAAMRRYVAAGGGLPAPGMCAAWCRARRDRAA